jgi:hypothetical protein
MRSPLAHLSHCFVDDRLAQKQKNTQFHYIVDHISSDDFKDIEKKWKIYIPLNRADIEEYTR